MMSAFAPSDGYLRQRIPRLLEFRRRAVGHSAAFILRVASGAVWSPLAFPVGLAASLNCLARPRRR
jgi:hypothetical protein